MCFFVCKYVIKICVKSLRLVAIQPSVFTKEVQTFCCAMSFENFPTFISESKFCFVLFFPALLEHLATEQHGTNFNLDILSLIQATEHLKRDTLYCTWFFSSVLKDVYHHQNIFS